MLSTNQLQFEYPDGKSFVFPDFQCSKGETLLITGKSGSGKTTLLHLLAGILQPSKGTVWIDGTEMVKLRGSALDRFRSQQIGLVYQKPHFVASLSVLDNLLLPTFFGKTKRAHEHLKALAEQLGIEHTLPKKPAQLSLGEQQRVGIARALVNTPPILLADEPTSALDDENGGRVFELLQEQALKNGASLLIVTHDNRLKSRVQRQIQIH
jgi:putative ABC transport system ATP-binding protein